MQLTSIDWIVIFAYFALNLGIGFYYMKRASGDMSEFFLSGRSVSWWLAGTSMVATTFAADTPLVLHWLLGFSLIYAVLFGTGNLLFGHIGLGAGQIAFGCACGAVLFWNLNRLNWTVFK
jgi:SSS family solute:Na+ symporter